MQQVLPERRWAVGLTEKQYEEEFSKHHRDTSVRPSLKKYLSYVGEDKVVNVKKGGK